MLREAAEQDDDNHNRYRVRMPGDRTIGFDEATEAGGGFAKLSWSDEDGSRRATDVRVSVIESIERVNKFGVNFAE